MYTGANKTAQNSQRAFAAAMVQLLREKPYEDITISEICRVSGVSRQTFYALFQNKENVLRYEISQNYSYPRNIHPSPEIPLSRYLAHIFSRYVDANYDFLKLLIDQKLSIVFFQCLKEYLKRNEDKLLRDIDPCRRCYLSVYVAGTVTTIMDAYFHSGAKKEPQYLEDLLNDLFDGSYFQEQYT